MNKQQRKSSSVKSDFHRSSQAFLIAYLISQFDYTEDLAHKVVQTNNCLNMAEMMDLFLRDENGLYGHVFIPNKHKTCQICGQLQTEHKLSGYSNQALSQKQFFDSNNSMDQSQYFRKILKSQISNKQQRTECQICCIQYLDDQVVHINGKKHQVCLGCMSEYLRQEIINGQVQNMRCPHCAQVLTPEIIRGFVDGLTFSKYQSFLRNLDIQNNPNLKWCPNPKCSVVIRAKNNKKTVKCNKCGTSICTKCNRQAHPRKSCNAVFKSQIKNWEDASDIQKCKKCKALVQKISGCNHMSCSVCRNEWCWLCGGSYSEIHFSPVNPFGCPGLQDINHSQWGKCRIMLWRITMLILIILLFPLAVPVSMLIAGPGILIALGLDHFYQWGWCRKTILVIFCIIIGQIINPFIWIGAIIYSIPKGISLLIQYIRKRKRRNQYTDDLLRQRLLREAQNIQDIQYEN